MVAVVVKEQGGLQGSTSLSRLSNADEPWLPYRSAADLRSYFDLDAFLASATRMSSSRQRGAASRRLKGRMYGVKEQGRLSRSRRKRGSTINVAKPNDKRILRASMCLCHFRL